VPHKHDTFGKRGDGSMKWREGIASAPPAAAAILVDVNAAGGGKEVVVDFIQQKSTIEVRYTNIASTCLYERLLTCLLVVGCKATCMYTRQKQ
jgi:hypothetical protein